MDLRSQPGHGWAGKRGLYKLIQEGKEMEVQDRLLTFDEARAILKSENFNTLVAEGKLVVKHIGDCCKRIPLSSVQNYLQAEIARLRGGRRR